MSSSVLLTRSTMPSGPTQWARADWFDVWSPVRAPSARTVAMGLRATTPAQWAAYARRYRAEMKAPAARHALALLAALSRTSDFAVGCYCADEAWCHRSL